MRLSIKLFKSKAFKITCSLAMAIGLFFVPAHADQLMYKNPTTYQGKPAYSIEYLHGIDYFDDFMSKVYTDFIMSRDGNTCYSSKYRYEDSLYGSYHYECVNLSAKPVGSCVVKGVLVNADGSFTTAADYSSAWEKVAGPKTIGTGTQGNAPTTGGGSSSSSSSSSSGGRNSGSSTARKSSGTQQSSKSSGSSQSSSNSNSSSSSQEPAQQQTGLTDEEKSKMAMNTNNYHMVRMGDIASSKNLKVNVTVVQSNMGYVEVGLTYDSAGTAANQLYADCTDHIKVSSTTVDPHLRQYQTKFRLFETGTYYVSYYLIDKTGKTYIMGYYGPINVTDAMLKDNSPRLDSDDEESTNQAKTDYTIPAIICGSCIAGLIVLAIIILKKKKKSANKKDAADKENNEMSEKNKSYYDKFKNVK